jgi:hypothetical protein
MSSGGANPNGGASWRGLWPVAVVVAVACVLAFFLIPDRKGPPGGGPRKVIRSGMSDEECERLTARLNEAVGSLEAGELQKAESAFLELSQKFPREPAAVRNLAICRLLIFDAVPLDDSRSDPAAARTAIEAAKKIEPGSAIPHILAARLAARADDVAAAVAELEQAAKLSPDDAAVWFELYSFGEVAGDDNTVRRRARDALTAAIKADPENSYLLKQNLSALADEKDPRALEALETLRAKIEPVLPTVKRRIGVDFDDLRTQLTGAVREGNWPKAKSLSMRIDNGIKSDEWIKSDLRRLRPHTLAFVVQGFSPGMCAAKEARPANSNPAATVQFNAAASEGQFPELHGVRDVNLSDFDLDGVIDAIVLTEGELSVISRSAGKPWQTTVSAAVRGPMVQLLVGDLDRDGKLKASQSGRGAPGDKSSEAGKDDASCQPADVEVVVLGPGGVQIFRNDSDPQTGRRSLLPVEQDEGLEKLRGVLAGVLADIDHDGDLDLVLSTSKGLSFWKNLGKLKFGDITDRSAGPADEVAVTSLVAVDWDRDLDVDILLCGPGGAPAGWLENLRHGAMRWRAFEGDLGKLSGSTKLNLADIDGNASWDLLGTGPEGARLIRTQTPVAGRVEPVGLVEMTKTPVAGSLIGDFDNDSNSDLAVWGDGGLKIFWNLAAAQRLETAVAVELPPAEIVACAAADMDGDGDLDLVVVQAGRMVLYDNDGGNRNHWLEVRCRGEDGDKQGDVNHLGIGSLVEIKAGLRYQAQVVTGQVTHFGLGMTKAVDVVRVTWTNGVPQPAVSPSADVVICRAHDPKGSCPYLYIWTGERFEFCTDACWGAPLGLQLAEGVFAQPRAWEYLTIPGDRLKPRGGKYVVQMTEELWEAMYLDRMELIAVDHPADVAVFSNEKVGPPELATFKIHTVRDRRLPVAASDKHGRDVLDQIAREDGLFMKGFDAAPRRGLTDEHFLELDLGPLLHPQRVTLFLTGWLYPASTSLNVGISQDRLASAPRPPALEVPDEHGNWQVVRPFMGFPGGKTKTIAVDLSGVFLTDDYRVRIVTNLELCWDAAFFAVDEEPAPFDLVRLPVASADLHFRGYSKIVRNPAFGPDGYDYNSVSTATRWAPMFGRFTRYGDVTELLHEEDDLQVIFGSGDELTVTFDVPQKAPREGWKRDFLLHNVGWDKDNDLNVVTSQQVEPLPFQAMSGYPYRADEQYPDTPRHREYLRKYQSREQFPMTFWRQVQQFELRASRQ